MLIDNLEENQEELKEYHFTVSDKIKHEVTVKAKTKEQAIERFLNSYVIKITYEDDNGKKVNSYTDFETK